MLESLLGHTVLNLTYLVIGGYLLVRGADRVVDQSVSLAFGYNISPAIVGAVVIALGTSLPEWVVSVLASVGGHSEIAFGNVLGSNLVNLGGVLAVALLAGPITSGRSSQRWDAPFAMLAAVAVALFTVTGEVSRTIAIGLLAIMVLYIGGTMAMIRRSRNADSGNQKDSRVESFSWIWLLVGFVLLLVGARVFVDGASSIARAAGVPEWIIGVTLVSIGTSLPELATTVTSLGKGQTGLGLGNILGSNIWNTFFILGSAAAIKPMRVDSAMVYDSGNLVLMSLGVLLLPLARGGVIGRKTAVLLLVLYGTSVVRWIGQLP